MADNSNDEFERIVQRLPELEELDDGITVMISHQGTEVYVTGVDFSGWVAAMLRRVAECPMRWFEALEECADQPEIVMRAVVRKAYDEVAAFFFEEAAPEVMPDLLIVMEEMAKTRFEPYASERVEGGQHV